MRSMMVGREETHSMLRKGGFPYPKMLAISVKLFATEWGAFFDEYCVLEQVRCDMGRTRRWGGQR